MTLNFRGIPYQQIELDACLPLAQRFQAEHKDWHFHILPPDCLHNPFPSEYALVMEDDTSATPYIAQAGDSFPEVDKVLVRMLHGESILDVSASAEPEELAGSRMLANLRDLHMSGSTWHHHMHFPGCVINPLPGQWSISVESPGFLFVEAFAEEPIGVLREVEMLFFGKDGGQV
jgi:hypothetical protein